MSINTENLIKIFNSCERKSYENLLNNLKVIPDKLKLFLIEKYDENEIYKMVKCKDAFEFICKHMCKYNKLDLFVCKRGK